MAFNVGIALGPLIGGAVVSGGNMLVTGPMGALMALAGAGLAMALGHRIKRSAKPELLELAPKVPAVVR